MNFYRQSIILFGVVIPVIIAAAVVGVGFFVKSKMADSYDEKKVQFKSHLKSRSEVTQLEQEVKEMRPHLKRWEEELSKEIASEMSAALREITSKLPDKEINLTSFNPSPQSGGLSGPHASEKISMGFRGTFRALQQTLLELEVRMPQLQVEVISLEPVGSSGHLLNMQISYTAWNN